MPIARPRHPLSRDTSGLRALVLGCLIAAGASGCTCGKQKVVVEKVDVDAASVGQLPFLGWSADQTVQAFTDALKRAHCVVLEEGEKGEDGSLRLQLAFSPPDDEDPRPGQAAEIDAALIIRAHGGDTNRSISAVGRLNPTGTGLEETRDAYQAAAKRAMEQLAVQVHALSMAEREKDEILVKQLEGKSLEEKHAAMRILAERKNSAAVGPLVEQLQLDQPDLVHQAIGGLVEVGDPKAVPALIDAAHAKDEVFQREIVFALGQLGGEDAEAYLFTVAQGAEDSSLGLAARQALEELRARAKKDGGA